MVDADELLLKDWSMTKDRIKHFDDIIMRIRVQAIPIGTAFLTIGWGLENIETLWSPYVFLFASLYIIPVAMFDWLHYKLMLLSIKRAKEIENLPQFKDHLCITHRLTNEHLTRVHNIAIIFVYTLVFLAGIISFMFSTNILSI